MATTAPKKHKVSWSSLLSLILTILPLILEFVNSDERNAIVELDFNEKTQKLRASVRSEEDAKPAFKSVTNK